MHKEEIILAVLNPNIKSFVYTTYTNIALDYTMYTVMYWITI